MTFLGIDLCTSAVKVILVDENQNLIDQASAALNVSRPHPLWSEQNPEEWWTATNRICRPAGADIYAMRGRRIERVDSRSGRVDIRALLGNHPARIHMIRSRP